MFRYFCMIWSPARSRQASVVGRIRERLALSSSRWTTVLDGNGLHICAADIGNSNDIQLLSQDGGAVVGTLYRRNSDLADDSPAPLSKLSTDECASIIAGKGRPLIDRYWGNYVAFVTDARANVTKVIKDPTGSLPCYVTSFEGVTIVFSSVADCLELGVASFTINRNFLEARMLLESDPAQRDPLQQVQRIYGGECITVAPGTDVGSTQREFYWTPLRFNGVDDLIEDSSFAARVTRATIRSCAHTLAQRHDRLLLRLSGGLDSSIVAGCLRDLAQDKRITAYTYFNPRGRSSELDWARMSARHSGLHHIEYAIESSEMDLAGLRDTMPTVEPALGLMHLQKMTLEAGLTRQTQSTGVFSGDGGDAVFCSLSNAHAVTELLRHKGLSAAALRLASQLAAARDMSFGTLLFRSLRDWIVGGTRQIDAAEDLQACVLVADDLREKKTQIEVKPHPWFDSPRVPPSIAERLGVLPYVVEYYYGSDQRRWQAEELAPLYAQPVVESLLRMPLYMHCEGGYDRTLARRAFVDDVPEPILKRQWKDRAPGIHYQMLQKNLPFLREMLLDGVLVRERLLNRQAVEQALSGDPTRSRVYPGELLNHLDSEIWARRWATPARYSAVA
jgi:asparagine synthase (glutamine-hydrolysing)